MYLKRIVTAGLASTTSLERTAEILDQVMVRCQVMARCQVKFQVYSVVQLLGESKCQVMPAVKWHCVSGSM